MSITVSCTTLPMSTSCTNTQMDLRIVATNTRPKIKASMSNLSSGTQGMTLDLSQLISKLFAGGPRELGLLAGVLLEEFHHVVGGAAVGFDLFDFLIEPVDRRGTFFDFPVGGGDFLIDVIGQALLLHQHLDHRKGRREVQAPKHGHQHGKQAGQQQFFAMGPDVGHKPGQAIHGRSSLPRR